MRKRIPPILSSKTALIILSLFSILLVLLLPPIYVTPQEAAFASLAEQIQHGVLFRTIVQDGFTWMDYLCAWINKLYGYHAVLLLQSILLSSTASLIFLLMQRMHRTQSQFIPALLLFFFCTPWLYYQSQYSPEIMITFALFAYLLASYSPKKAKRHHLVQFVLALFLCLLEFRFILLAITPIIADFIRKNNRAFDSKYIPSFKKAIPYIMAVCIACTAFFPEDDQASLIHYLNEGYSLTPILLIPSILFLCFFGLTTNPSSDSSNLYPCLISAILLNPGNILFFSITACIFIAERCVKFKMKPATLLGLLIPSSIYSWCLYIEFEINRMSIIFFLVLIIGTLICATMEKKKGNHRTELSQWAQAFLCTALIFSFSLNQFYYYRLLSKTKSQLNGIYKILNQKLPETDTVYVDNITWPLVQSYIQNHHTEGIKIEEANQDSTAPHKNELILMAQEYTPANRNGRIIRYFKSGILITWLLSPDEEELNRAGQMYR